MDPTTNSIDDNKHDILVEVIPKDEKSYSSADKVAEAQERYKQMMLTINKNNIRPPEEEPLIGRDIAVIIPLSPVNSDISTSTHYNTNTSTNTPFPKKYHPFRSIYSREIIPIPNVNARPHVRREINDVQPPEDNTMIDSVDGHRVHNNWTSSNINTVNKWKREIKEASFIYEFVKDKNNAVYQKILIWMLVFNTINTVVTAVQGAILSADPENPKAVWVGFCLSVFLFIVGGTNTILAGAVSIYKWDKIVNNLSTHISKLDGFYAAVSHELNLSDRLRKNANDFITKNSEAYLHITQNCPDIKNIDYIEAEEKFKTVNDNTSSTTTYKSSQKYTF